MAEKILYILGAGASAQVLPLAKSVYKDKETNQILDVPGLIYSLKNFDFLTRFNYITEKKYKDYIELLKADFKTLALTAEEFGDIDTYAKYLYLLEPDGNDFRKLKENVAQYFVLKQSFENVRDKRYLAWFVNIMSKKLFPDDIKILSWNYDFQVEFAAMHFWEAEKIAKNKGITRHSTASLNYYPNLAPRYLKNEIFSLIHLNGIAGFGKNSEGDSYSLYQKYMQNSTNEEKLDFLMSHNLSEFFHFAWEKQQSVSEMLNYVEKMIEGTTIIVVIGYSFPFFNREIDKRVMNSIWRQKQLKKIYYQDPVLDGKQLYSQFGIPEGFPIVHVTQKNNFHVPFEY